MRYWLHFVMSSGVDELRPIVDEPSTLSTAPPAWVIAMPLFGLSLLWPVACDGFRATGSARWFRLFRMEFWLR